MRAIHRVRAYDLGRIAYGTAKPNPYPERILQGDWDSGRRDLESANVMNDGFALRSMNSLALRRAFIEMVQEGHCG